ncbi:MULTISPECIES: thiamine-phosphate kinase [Halolamina]|uniref:Thiamine-monophosphate kinase n=1 Tax=Halolamina pelagica TaxID=699431 RepID=A0A1I5Q722_9EURY|nr:MULTISPECIES: thiamine-phosphate kinase [Halolamina]NHX35121.1 thiamine-phosphate kinase [Halolamina sp. R1-12]SFP41937.1 thiamine-monophosphate kinase [Halolamina pelagica]
MDERSALAMLSTALPGAGDDAAVVGDLAITTDMLHERSDFPAGTTRETAGWRAVGASLSDLAAMGADATCAVAVYAAPAFEEAELSAFVRGASEVCERVDAEYVGGDLDEHTEFTTATTAVGHVEDPIYRDGAAPGDAVCVTGELGRTAAGLRKFAADDAEAGNDLFRFTPRVAAGRALRGHTSAMMDSSDGLARSLHQLAEASDCGFEIEWDRLPVHPAVDAVADDEADRRECAAHVGEDFELVFTTPDPAAAVAAVEATGTDATVIGEATESGVVADGDALPDRGYTHGEH